MFISVTRKPWCLEWYRQVRSATHILEAWRKLPNLSWVLLALFMLKRYQTCYPRIWCDIFDLSHVFGDEYLSLFGTSTNKIVFHSNWTHRRGWPSIIMYKDPKDSVFEQDDLSKMEDFLEDESWWPDVRADSSRFWYWLIENLAQ